MNSPANLIDKCLKSRENNFLLIRFFAAFSVLYSHSFTLANSSSEPIFLPGITFGELGVSIFFVISGFLVTRSILFRKSIKSYIISRLARIMPALLGVLLFSIFIIGLLFSEFPASEFLNNPEVWNYFTTNIKLLPELSQYHLPGVFLGNPYPEAVNGSLWTLPFEVWMYIFLIIFFVSGFLKNKFIASIIPLTLLIILGIHSFNPFLSSSLFWGIKFGVFFFTSSVCFLFRDKININLITSSIIFALLILTFLFLPRVAPIIFPLFLSYFVLFIAFHFRGKILKFNNIGDYSYGIYLYAFPIQQALAETYNLSPVKMFVCAGIITFFLAMLSWHLIEKPVLNLVRK